MKFMKNQDKAQLSINTTLDDNESILSQVQKPNNWINDYVKNLKKVRRKNQKLQNANYGGKSP